MTTSSKHLWHERHTRYIAGKTAQVEAVRLDSQCQLRQTRRRVHLPNKIASAVSASIDGSLWNRPDELKHAIPDANRKCPTPP